MLLTNTIIVRLFFTGLIAFSPDEFRCGRAMSALLVDTTSPPASSDGCHIHYHEPALYFYSDDCGECEKDGKLCRCPLGGNRYLLDLPFNAAKPLCWQENYQPPSSTTSSADCDGDHFRYLTRMRDLRTPLPWVRNRAALKSRCRSSCPEASMCDLVVAQVNFSLHGVQACVMSGETEDRRKAPKLQTMPVSSGNFWDGDPRFTAEILRFTHLVESPNAAPPKSLTLKLVSFDRSADFEIEIPVIEKNSTYYADLIVGNIMEGEPPKGRCSNDSVARDFELFHDLAAGPLYPSDRPVPQIREGSADELLPDGVGGAACDDSLLFRIWRADFLRAGKARPICPEVALE